MSYKHLNGKENFPQSSGTESFFLIMCWVYSSLGEGCWALCWLSSIHAWWRTLRRCVIFIFHRQALRPYSTVIYRWVNSGQKPQPALPRICILGASFFFFFFWLRDENEPTAPANEDLVGANSFQERWLCASACVGRRKKKKKKKSTGALQNAVKQNRYLHSVCRHAFLSLSGSWGRVLINYKCLCVDEFMHVCFPGKIVFFAWPTG